VTGDFSSTVIQFTAWEESAMIQPQCPPGDITIPHPQQCHPERSEGSAVAVASFKVPKLPNWRQFRSSATPTASAPFALR
jgi:hypothetical protein